MQLGFRGTDADSQHVGDLFVFKSFDVVEDEDRPISRGQLRDGLVQRDAVDKAWTLGAGLEKILNLADLALFGRLLESNPTFAEVHQDVVDREAMQPRGESRFASEAADLAKELDEDLLRQVFGFSGVGHHPQT